MKRSVVTGNVSMASKYGSEIIQLILWNEVHYCLRVFVDSDSGSNKISEIKHTEIRDECQYVTRVQSYECVLLSTWKYHGSFYFLQTLPIWIFKHS